MGSNIVNNDNNDFEQEVQAYIDNMNKELSVAEQLMQDMKNSNTKTAQDEQSILKHIAFIPVSQISKLMNRLEVSTAYDKYMEGYIPSATSKITDLHSMYQKIQTDEANLKAIDPNINGTVIDQLNQLFEKSDALMNSGLFSDDLNNVTNQTTKLIQELCDVIMNGIQIDLAQAGMKQFASDSSSGATAAVLQFAGLAIQAECQQQITLQNIQTDVIDDSVGWNKEKSSAEADLKTSHWYDFFTGGGPNEGVDHIKINLANEMITLLMGIEQTISPLIATIDPGMQEFSIELDQLKQKFADFLGGKGTIQDLKDAMVAALSILVGIIAETTKDEAMYNKQMNQGSMASSEMSLNDSLSQQEVIDDAQKYAAIMGKLLKAVQYIGIALVFLMNPGIGMALMAMLDALLTATGVMDKLQTALQNSKLGTIGGTIMTCAIEMVGTAGGAAGVDKAIALGVKGAIKATVEAVVKTIEEIIKAIVETAMKAIKAASKEVSEVGVKAALQGASKTMEAGGEKAVEATAKAAAAAEKVGSKTVNMAVDTAKKKLIAMFMNKTVTEFLGSLKSIFNGEFRAMVEAALKEAAENAGKEVQPLADTAAKQGSADVIGETEMESIAKTSANRGVADTTKTTEESVAKVDRRIVLGKDLGEKTGAGKFAWRAGWTGVSAMGTTGLPTELAVWSQNKKSKDDLSEQSQIAMQVIQTLMQFIGMIGASDIGASSIMAPGPLNKLLLGASAADSSMQAVGSAGMAEANFEQAGAVQAIAKDQSMLDTMEFIMSQLKKDGQSERDLHTKEMQQVSKTNLSLAMHFNDANQAMAEALAVLPV